jgi:hypothetical protein
MKFPPHIPSYDFYTTFNAPPLVGGKINRFDDSFRKGIVERSSGSKRKINNYISSLISGY